jgi:hypothetical protein
MPSRKLPDLCDDDAQIGEPSLAQALTHPSAQPSAWLRCQGCRFAGAEALEQVITNAQRVGVAVSVGFTVPMLGKKLVSTSRGCQPPARQFTSRTDVVGSVPKRQVPVWGDTGHRNRAVEIGLRE